MPYYRQDFSTAEMEILEHEIAAGFLLINLKELRNDHKQEEIINFYVNNYPRLRLPEQDCIILTCWPHIKYLPIGYSLPISFYRLNMNQRDFTKAIPNLQETKSLHSLSLMKDWHIPYKFIMQVSTNHGIVSGSSDGKIG